jgi:hypothetical protein
MAGLDKFNLTEIICRCGMDMKDDMKDRAPLEVRLHFLSAPNGRSCLSQLISQWEEHRIDYYR